MLRQSLLTTVAVIAMAGSAIAQDDKGGGNAGKNATQPPSAGSQAPPSAADKAPGQMKREGSPARDLAPGRTKGDGESARDEAPGRNKEAQEKTGDQRGDDGDRGDKARQARDGDAKGDNASKANKGSLTGVTPEQKTKVRSAFGKHRVAPVKDLDINVSVGVVVPRSVRFYPVPQDIIALAPAYDGFLYFVVDDRICIVDPGSYEVVEIIFIA